MTDEIWVDIPDYEDKYQISSNGNVKLKARDILDAEGKVLTQIPESLLEIRNTEHDPYPHVVLHNGTTYVKASIESLKHSAFVD